MKLSQQAFFWLGALGAFFVFVWAFDSILMPFITGAAVAYLLNPLVNRFGDWGAPRWLATSIILVLFILLMVIFGLLVGPILAKEIVGFFEALPGYVETLSQHFAPYVMVLQEKLGVNGTQDVLAGVKENSGAIISVAKNIFGSLLAGGTAIFGWISFLLLMPVVAFYMLKDWPVFAKVIDGLWPRQNVKTIREILAEIDLTISSFVRGQLLVAFILGLFYGISLTILGLEYGFLVGFTAGMLSIVPYVGSIIGFVASTVLAWVQFQAVDMVAYAGAIFVVGQMIEGNFLTPKLVGDKVGLHALWVIFALMAGASVMGFTGILIAVPVAAVVGVMLRFTLKQYKNSTYYK